MNRETGMTNAAGTGIGRRLHVRIRQGRQPDDRDRSRRHTTTTTYDAMDRVSTVEDADTGMTSYAYDNDGRLYVLTDPDRNATTFSYNAVGEADRGDLAVGE